MTNMSHTNKLVRNTWGHIPVDAIPKLPAQPNFFDVQIGACLQTSRSNQQTESQFPAYSFDEAYDQEFAGIFIFIPATGTKKLFLGQGGLVFP